MSWLLLRLVISMHGLNMKYMKGLLYPRCSVDSRLSGLQGGPGGFGERKRNAFQPRIEMRFLGHQFCSLVTMLSCASGLCAYCAVR